MPASCALLTCEREGLAGPAIAFASRHFDLRICAQYPDPTSRGIPGELEELAMSGQIEYLFSFLSPVVVPELILNRVRMAVNFHPAPPRWPGIGAPCYALYHGDEFFGVTAHLMEPTVDTGTILRVDRFPVLSTDSQASLLERAQYRALSLYYDVLAKLAQHESIEPSGDRWERTPLTRKQFERWLTLSTTDTVEEVAAKIRSGTHPRLPGPILQFHGYRFAYMSDNP
jgi:methionyl-tRNA formyltransferase